MNARELLDDLESGLIDEFMSAEVKAIYIRALRLLAAAEANDGTTPETDAAEIKIQSGFKEVPTGTVQTDYARRLERERNGLAARVRELERVREYAVHLTGEVERALSDDNLCGREIDDLLCNALAERPAGFTESRSKRSKP